MDCMEYPAVVAESDGFCLSVCDGKSIIITAEINKAIIIGSITVTGSGRNAGMPNTRWQRPNDFDSIIGKKLPLGTRKHNRIPYSRVSFLSRDSSQIYGSGYREECCGTDTGSHLIVNPSNSE